MIANNGSKYNACCRFLMPKDTGTALPGLLNVVVVGDTKGIRGFQGIPGCEENVGLILQIAS